MEKRKARDEKKAATARKKKDAAAQRIEKMRSQLELEMKKMEASSIAGEEAGEEASRAASAKGTNLSQASSLNPAAPSWTGREEKTLSVRSDKKTKFSAGGSVNNTDFAAVSATSPQRKPNSTKCAAIDEPPTIYTPPVLTYAEGTRMNPSRLRPANLFRDPVDIALSPYKQGLVNFFDKDRNQPG